MRRIAPIILFIAISICFNNAIAQTHSTINKDSQNTALLKNSSQSILLRDQQNIKDSIKKVSLQQELNSMQTISNLKEAELRKQLEDLNKKENDLIAKRKTRIDSLRSTTKFYPVKGFFNDTLFNIYNKLGSFSAKDRATAISERINKLGSNYKFSSDSLLITPTETTVDLMYGEVILASISDQDAIWNDSSKNELAKQYKSIISRAIIKYKSETSFGTLAKEIGLSLLVILSLGIALLYVGRLFKWSATKINNQKDRQIKGLKIKNYTLLNADRQVSLLLFLNRALKWIVIIVLMYVALPILFGIFPWTKDFAETLFGYVLNPLKHMLLGLWNYLPNLFTIIVIFMVFRYAIKAIHYLKNEVETGKLKLPGFYPDWANPTYQIIKVLLYAFMFVSVFPFLPGSDSPIFKGVSVFLGFLFTFGSAGSLSNIIAGVVLTYMRLFKIGDRVKIGDVTGDVTEKSLLVTRIKTIKNEIISIPNSTVMSSHTINYSNETEKQGLIIYTTVTIGYDVPWRKMHQALLNAADRTEFLLNEPKPFVLQTSLDDFYVSYQINAYTKEANKQATIYSELHANIQDCCFEVGIEILSPHYRAERDGNMTAIPENYLGKNSIKT